VINGVIQPITKPFGSDLKNDPNLVFGLVDAKYSKDAQNAQIIQEASANLTLPGSSLAIKQQRLESEDDMIAINGNKISLKTAAAANVLFAALAVVK